MTLDLRDCIASGPALPEPFLRFGLGPLMEKRGLLPKPGRALEQARETLRRQIAALGGTGGPLRVHNHIVAPLASAAGYGTPQRQEPVATREGTEDGGWLLRAANGTQLRSWTVAADVGLDAPHRNGRAWRFSPLRIASRVLAASGEPAGLLTDGSELRLLLCDAARADSWLAMPLTGPGSWSDRATEADSFRLLLALAGPPGLAALPDILDAARLSQARVTKDLRVQARSAVEGFLQAVLDDPANVARLRGTDRGKLARDLWQEGLVLVYRLLFILKLESGADPARAFSFASTSLWRQALSPNRALGPLVRRHLDQGHDTGRMLADGLHTLFRAFRDGVSCSELCIRPLGGALFGVGSAPLLESLHWSERAAAILLDRLLWTTPKGRERERVQYGPLNVEELGRVYEALLELEPGIATRPMVRLRRARLEAVVPAAHVPAAVDDHGEGEGDDDSPGHDNIVRKQEIPAGRFWLRAGLGRKATGSYYTPHEFVRFLVRETLGPLIAERSPDDDPNPAGILSLKVVDPATGSGHFLVEACRFIGEALYAACRLCDTGAAAAEARATTAPDTERSALLARAAALRARVAALPDPDRSLSAYLPGRATEGEGNGVSQDRALVICRRMVAVHCLYGVDRNPLAVELAKLSLWLESYAEGLPLTFLDHRLVHGDSLAGPFFAQLATLPVGGGDLDPLLAHGVADRLGDALHAALAEVRALQATVGRDAADLALKEGAKVRLDAALHPLRQLACVWSGAAMTAPPGADDEYQALAQAVAGSGAPGKLSRRQAKLLAAGADALSWDLTFPEVFLPDATGARTAGFDAVLGNPPWDIVQQNAKEFLGNFDLSILNAPTKREAEVRQARLLNDPAIAAAFRAYQENFQHQHRLTERLYTCQKHGPDNRAMGGKLDAFRVFAERSLQLAGPRGTIGMVVPSSFHANEGATAIRDLFLRQTDLQCCLSFENRRRLFDIHVRQKFALLVARRPGPTRVVRCGFYLDDPTQVGDPTRIMRYDRSFIEKSGGVHLTFLELRGAADLAVARRVFLRHPSLHDWTARRGIVLGREMNITDDAHRITPVSRLRRGDDGYLLLHEGKTIQQYDDRWEPGPRYAVPLAAIDDKPTWVEATRHYRLALRKIARSTDERTAIAAFTSPGYLFNDTAPVERTPQRRCNADALLLCGVINSFVFDWALRQKAAATINLFILEACPVCELAVPAARFVAHGALRLSCNHAAYAPLWQEQLGHARHPRRAWPAVAGKEARWRLRAAMDAVVAGAFELDRGDYARILEGFAHKQHPAAPALCLEAFDALAADGLAAFCRAHDPYDDIPLRTALAALVGVGPSVHSVRAA